MKKYIKKPIPVSAIQWTGKNNDEIHKFCTNEEGKSFSFQNHEHIWIGTKEGDLKAKHGDYIIQGIEGEFYPCDKNIFEKSYVACEENSIKTLGNTTASQAKKNVKDIVFWGDGDSDKDVSISETLLPYSFHIKNLTDEKLYDVDLFNYDHEKQQKIAYSYINGVPYDRFLGFLSSLNNVQEVIRVIRVSAFCDYPKFKRKQLIACLHTIYNNPNGISTSTPNEIGNYLSPYQQQSDIIEVPLTENGRIKLFNQLQLRLDYLMPESEVFISLFPVKINNQ